MNLCPGAGPEFGSAIVEHPQTRLIAFTGSKKVGLEIHERAARTQPGQHFIKRTILEMGGKDAIIVDADCDLDAAVEGVVASAFGFNGQKCSACSRVIVDESRSTTSSATGCGSAWRRSRPAIRRRMLCRPGDQRDGVDRSPRLHRDRQERKGGC